MSYSSAFADEYDSDYSTATITFINGFKIYPSTVAIPDIRTTMYFVAY
jgi:hypothetical protein